MRAKTVNENMAFKRGQEVKNSAGIGQAHKFRGDLITEISYYETAGCLIKWEMSRVSGLEPNQIYSILDWWRTEGDGNPNNDISNIRSIIGDTKPYYDDYGPEDSNNPDSLRYLVYDTDYGKFIELNDEQHNGNTMEWFGDLKAKISSEE